MRRLLDGGFELDDDRDRIDVRAVHTYLSGESYWAQGRSFEDVERSVREAARVVGLYRDGRQVGFARTVDLGEAVGWAASAYLADVYVLEECRGRGLGTELVRESVQRGPFADRRWLLRTLDAHRLYEQSGFAVPDERWMIREPRA
jgi:GNAT superfamily N-acetyltransferase